MEISRLKSLVESLVFVAEQPLKFSEILKAVHALERDEAAEPLEGEEEISTEEALGQQDAAEQLENYAAQEEGRVSKGDLQEVLEQLSTEYQDNPERGILLVEVAGGWQFRTRPENAGVIRHLFQPKPTRLSKPSLETLSIVAYRQPITRVEIDEIRGVDSGGVLKTLCEKDLVRIVGKKDEPGRPMLYGTTQEFLELFQLKSLKELPGLRDYRDLEEEFKRRSGEEGVVLEVEEEEGGETESSILELSVENELAPLDSEEEEILEGLEENIKDVRRLEKEIFRSEKQSEDSDDTQALPRETSESTPTPDA